MLLVKTKSVCWKAKQIFRLVPVLLALAVSTSCGNGTAARVETKPFRALVFTKTTGFRHDSIPDGVRAIRRLGRDHGFSVDTTADAARFTPGALARYDVVIFLSTTGTPIKRGAQRRAFEGYIRAGGGFVGVHAASDTRGDWPWYEGLVGTRFKRHDPGTSARSVGVPDRRSAATRGLPEAWRRTDEWYEFRSNPRGRVHLLALLDETRPLTW
jgi:type 1 glutamine amidotransferase